jgi:drug/metabolite transporter (DMT)-like permease
MSAAVTSRVARRVVPWQARLILLAAIWGLSFLFIKVGDEALPPLQVALGRLILGTLTLLVILAIRHEGLPKERRIWFHLAVTAILFNSVPFSLFAYGETHTTSVLAGIWNSTATLFAVPFSMLMLATERPSRSRLAGIVVGFLGVLVVMGVWRGFGGSAFIGNLACLGAALCYGIGFPYMRRYLTGHAYSTISLAAGQLICGTVQLALITPFVTTIPHALPLKVIGSMLALGMLGTGLAYILNYSLVRDAGATTASTVAYLIPLFSTAAGVIILGEPLAWYEPVGAVVVIAGVAISQGRLRWEWSHAVRRVLLPR